MTLFSRQSPIPTLALLSLTALIASTVLINSTDDADARHRRGHRTSVVRPPQPSVALPAVAPLPIDNPRAAAPEAPKPVEKPAEEMQKADPQTAPLPEQKPAPETKPAEKPKEPPKPAEQLGPNLLPKSGVGRQERARGKR